MDDPFVFPPNRRTGVFFHVGLITLLFVFGLWGIWRASNANVGPFFFAYLIPAVFSTLLILLLIYRLYALYNAYYVLARDGIRIHWGLRDEQIPMDVIEWVHPADDLEPAVPLPVFRWPGGILGTRLMPGGGRVEFLASTTKDMLVIATPKIAYVISPSRPEEFQSTYHNLVELGTVSPITPHSVHPGLLINRVWSSPTARILILPGLSLNLILLSFVIFVILSLEQINLGFQPDGQPGALVPAIRLMLLPVLGFGIYFVDLFAGIFFYRIEESRDLSFIIWFFGALVPLLLLIGVVAFIGY